MTGCPTPLKIRAVTGNLTFQDIFREGGEGKIGAGLKKSCSVGAESARNNLLSLLPRKLGVVFHHFNLRRIVKF